jgi:hypothetical protein
LGYRSPLTPARARREMNRVRPRRRLFIIAADSTVGVTGGRRLGALLLKPDGFERVHGRPRKINGASARIGRLAPGGRRSQRKGTPAREAYAAPA